MGCSVFNNLIAKASNLNKKVGSTMESNTPVKKRPRKDFLDAALAPNLLYTSWKSEYPEDAHRAAESVAMGVLSILVCTPLAHLGARLGGPYLLSKQEPPRPPPTEPEPENTDAKPDA
ncbi:hypothetical protein J6590_044640 [Homalodisca vitripennis]|nr:hypothetical protein J6590_044640 [Homalodisca vitripennis]